MAHTCREHCPIHDSLLAPAAAVWDLVVQGDRRRTAWAVLWLLVSGLLVYAYLSGFRTPLQLGLLAFDVIVTLVVVACIIDAITHPKTQARRSASYFASLRRRRVVARAPETPVELPEPEPVLEVPQLMPTYTAAYTPAYDTFQRHLREGRILPGDLWPEPETAEGMQTTYSAWWPREETPVAEVRNAVARSRNDRHLRVVRNYDPGAEEDMAAGY